MTNWLTRDVAERVPEALVVLGDGHDADDVRALHVHGLGVGAHDAGLDVRAVEHADVVLVHDRERGRHRDRGDRGVVGRSRIQAGRRDLDHQHLAAADGRDLRVVALGDLDHGLDLLGDRPGVLDDREVLVVAEDLVELAADLSAGQGGLESSEVHRDGALGQVDDLPDPGVRHGADLVERNPAL